jgi:hypothetical protein
VKTEKYVFITANHPNRNGTIAGCMMVGIFCFPQAKTISPLGENWP